MLRSIVSHWVREGHDVDVLSSQPSYKAGVKNEKQPVKEFVDDAQVIRLNLPSEAGKPLLRILNALRLGAGIFFQAVVKKHYDVIMVSTYPPVLGGWVAAVVAKLTGARFVYHCMDIHPEIGRISGEFSNFVVFSVLSRMDRWTCAQAKPVVVLSNDMASTLAGRNPMALPEIQVINNFSLPSSEPRFIELPFAWPDEAFVLLFAGNIGRFQGLEVLIDAMGNLRDRKDICSLLMGDGSEKKLLAEKARKVGANVLFVGHQPVEVAKAAMARASVGFVSLIPELYRYAYPSKTMTYLEQGCPVLVAVEMNSCLARDLVENGAGLAVPNGNCELLANAISSLADAPGRIDLMKKNAINFSTKVFDTNFVLEKWSSIVK
jgi:glycosyltransferase involved in cell wall biosynthesis